MGENFLTTMESRGLVHQATHQDALRDHLSQGRPADRRAYVGFDPTADSLTIGNLVGIMALARFQRAGHTPVAVMGGGTGLIGDPSGKSVERQLLTRERVDENVGRIRRIFDGLLDLTPTLSNACVLLNNADWLGRLGYLEALRDIGKHFSVNMMVQKDSVRERLHARDQGISYTEFSYMILQAYDFAHLRERHGVTLQMGGSDQYGNIVAGIDLVRRRAAHGGAPPPENAPPDAFGLTWPLVTKADGTKFGKTEGGAVWLSPDRTSPYAYHQFWLNTADADVGRMLKYYTFLPGPRLDELAESARRDPGARESQRVLAREATSILHGPTEASRAEHAAAALFSGDIAGLDERTLLDVFSAAPASDLPRARLEGEGAALLDVIVEAGLVSSRREAREMLASGSIAVNGRKAGPDQRLATSDLLAGAVIALRKGKKNWHLTRWR